MDDDPDSRALLRAAIAGEGFEPLTAPDGETALSILQKLVPDLILLDAVMPGLGGFETCRRIKVLSPVSHVPVIFMTGLTETENVIEGLGAGGVDYVTKPIILEELVARVHVHLGNARLTRGTLAALDFAKGRLISADSFGQVRWSNQEAENILSNFESHEAEDLSAQLSRVIKASRESLPAVSEHLFTGREARILIDFLGEGAPGEYLFALTESFEGIEALALQRKLGLTPREADVLLWVSRGKSNRDTSEILNISARTVNKHLEQIFVKLGIENRAAAAAIATRALVT